MTREEAIKQLKGDITESCATFSNQWEKDEEAISVAISALSDYDKMQKISLDLAFENDELMNKSRWIPVSERLPKIADVYRVTRYYPNNVMNPSYLVDACFFDGSNTWHNDNRINHDRAYADNVIAWQENPEPYEI